jgi:hypothetical protein
MGIIAVLASLLSRLLIGSHYDSLEDDAPGSLETPNIEENLPP